MNPEDPVRPYHAREEARGQEAADAVAAVLKQAEEHEERARAKRPPRKQPKWMLPLGIQLAVLAVYLLISPPGWITVRPIEGPEPAVQEEGLRIAMYVQSQQIEAYRVQHGRLPTTLAGTNGPAALIYDSTESPADFLGPAAATKLASGAGGNS
jgi:hypothetical protein